MRPFDIALFLLVVTTEIFPAKAFFSLPHPRGPYRIDRNLVRRLRADPEYKKLGGEMRSSPGCMSTDDEIHCFYATKDGTAGYAKVKARKAEFKDFGGKVKDQPQLVKYGANSILAFFITPDGYIAVVAVNTHTAFDDKVTVLEHYDTFLEAPGCTDVETTDSVFCVARATDARMYSFMFFDGKFEHRYYVDPNPTNPLTCAYNKGTTNIHCWSTDSAHILAEKVFRDNGLPLVPLWWKLYKKGRGRVLVVMPAAIPFVRALERDGDAMIDIYGTFGGSLRSEPACTNVDVRSIDCFALDEDQGIQRNFQQLGLLYVQQTSGWVHYGGKFVGKPSCVYSTEDRKLHCFMRDPENGLVEGIFPVVHAPRSVVT